MSSSSATVYISVSPPSGIINKGSLWFNPVNTKMNIWVLQPGGGEWVEVFNTPGDIPFVYVSASEPSNPINGSLWYRPSTEVLSIWVEDGIQSSWLTLVNNSCPPPQTANALVSNSPPLSPTQGLIWYNPIDQTLKVWAGSSWQTTYSSPTGKPTVFTSSSPPGDPSVGDLWWNPLAKELRVWKVSPTGDSWELITDNTPTTPTPPVYISSSEPYNIKQRYLWYNPQRLELKLWSGSSWILVSKVFPDFLSMETQGKINNSLLYYDAVAGKFKANANVTTSTLTDGGNF